MSKKKLGALQAPHPAWKNTKSSPAKRFYLDLKKMSLKKLTPNPRNDFVLRLLRQYLSCSTSKASKFQQDSRQKPASQSEPPSQAPPSASVFVLLY